MALAQLCYEIAACVAFASKTLTDTEKRYAGIEREVLAVVYGCDRFQTYLFGHNVTVHSDEKPLKVYT